MFGAILNATNSSFEKGFLFCLSIYCKFGIFREGLFSRNFAYAKFRENKTLKK